MVLILLLTIGIWSSGIIETTATQPIVSVFVAKDSRELPSGANITVEANTVYMVKIEVMNIDMDWSQEYVDSIELGGMGNFGTCNIASMTGGSDCGCKYLPCNSLNENNITTTNTSLNVGAEWTDQVASYSCCSSNEMPGSVYGAIRITLRLACSVNAAPGNGTLQGDCPDDGDICFSDGCYEKCSKEAIGGTPGDGDGTQGNCDPLQYCYNEQLCAAQCSKDPVNGSPGDGTGNTKGNCPAGTVCFPDGKCRSTDCLRVYEGVSSIPINNSVTINSDYYPGGHYIDDGGEDYYDSGNYIGVPAFTENHVTYLENCEVGLVSGSVYSMAMNNSAISCTVFLDYSHSSISIDGDFGDVYSATTGSYQYNQWKGFWKISHSEAYDYYGIMHHLWVTNSPIAEHVSNLHDIYEIDDPDTDADLVVGLKGYHVVYNFWITNMTIATPDDVIKQLVRAVADALAPEETCEDGIHNQDETDIDCGGVCPACEKGDRENSEICAIADCSQPKAGILCPGKCWSCKNYKGRNWCLNKKRAGECDHDWVNLRCRATCAKCCGNVYSASTCAKATYGVAGSRRCQFSTKVKNNCRRSCGLCG